MSIKRKNEVSQQTESPVLYVPDIKLIIPENVAVYERAASITGISVDFFKAGEVYDADKPDLTVPRGFIAVSIKCRQGSNDQLRFAESIY